MMVFEAQRKDQPFPESFYHIDVALEMCKVSLPSVLYLYAQSLAGALLCCNKLQSQS